jgi:hypothetical protein
MTSDSEITSASPPPPRSRSRRARYLAPLLAAPLLFGASRVQAQPTTSEKQSREASDAETRTIARELALQGAEALDNKDYATALDRFERAASLVRAPSLTVMQARTLVALGRFVEALDKYEETQRMPLPADAVEAFTSAVRDASKEAAELRPRLPWLRISLIGAEAKSPSVQVFLDDKPVRSATLDIERPIDPGNHDVEARSGGRTLARSSISLTEAEHRTLELALTPVVASPAPPREHETSSRGWSRQTWALAAGGVGVAGLGTALVTGLIALHKKSELADVCHPGCPESSADDLSSYRTNRTLAYVGLGVGVVGVGVGGYLLLSGTPSARHVAVGTSGTSAWLSGRF